MVKCDKSQKKKVDIKCYHATDHEYSVIEECPGGRCVKFQKKNPGYPETTGYEYTGAIPETRCKVVG